MDEKLILASQDAIAWLRNLPESCIDLVITDPPYESLEKHRAVGTTTRLTHSTASSNDWFAIFPNERFEALLVELHRVLKRNAHCYILCDQQTMFAMKPVGERAGFRFWKPLIWDKITIGMGYHYRARYELILFFEKGKRRLNDLAVPDILTVKRVTGGYPTEKPLALMQVLIKQSSGHGECVLDPFFGSGTTLLAARRLGRCAWGTDSSQDAYEHARRRLAAEGYCDGSGAGPFQPSLLPPG